MNLFTVTAKTSVLLYAVLLLPVAWSTEQPTDTSPKPTGSVTVPPEEHDPSSQNVSATTARSPASHGAVPTPAANTSDVFSGSSTVGKQGTDGPTVNESTTAPANTTTSNTTTVTDAAPAATVGPVMGKTASTAVSERISKSTAGTPTPAPAPAGGASGGTTILILILLAIAVLGGLLFYLRRKSRSYSFDLSCPLNDQASDNTPLKPVEMDTFYPKEETDTLAAAPSEVTDDAANHLDGPLANGSAEEAPGAVAITLDSNSTKSDHSESGTQVDVLEDTTLDGPQDDPLHISVEEQSGNENNNNITVISKAAEGPKSEEDFTEINLN